MVVHRDSHSPKKLTQIKIIKEEEEKEKKKNAHTYLYQSQRRREEEEVEEMYVKTSNKTNEL